MSKHRRQRVKRIRKARERIIPLPAGTYTFTVDAISIDLEAHPPSIAYRGRVQGQSMTLTERLKI